MQVIEILKETGALLDGHFILSSGKHSPNYVQCARLFEYPEAGEKIGTLLAEKIKEVNPTAVIGPAMGGIILSYEVARSLGVRNLFAERKDGKMQLRRGFAVSKNDRVAIVEDVVTTGGAVREVMELLKSLEVEVVCVGSVVDRSKGKADFGVPFKKLIDLDFPVYEKNECPLCEKNIPTDKPGSKT